MKTHFYEISVEPGLGQKRGDSLSLKELRERAHLRQVDVAKRLNVDQAAVSKWETGETKPSRKYHKKLAKLYGVTVDELFGLEADHSA